MWGHSTWLPVAKHDVLPASIFIRVLYISVRYPDISTYQWFIDSIKSNRCLFDRGHLFTFCNFNITACIFMHQRRCEDYTGMQRGLERFITYY